MSLYLGENLVSGVALPIEPTRNIGQIIQSTIPLTDAGLHLLDGSVIQGNGIYSSFVNYIKTLYDSGSYTTIFETENNWQTSILNYGVCGKFVYTAASGNNPATVRLPKIIGFVEGASGVSVLGNVVEAGLPNITGEFEDGLDGYFYNTVPYYSSTVSGAYNISIDDSTSVAHTSGQETNARLRKVSFDASQSNSIYNNSDTVQPQSVKVLYYIVIAASTKTEIEVDIDEIATDLNNKVSVSDLIEVQSVIEIYNNGTEWYRVWSDGWIEQGGLSIGGGSSFVTTNFLKPFVDTSYTIVTALLNDENNSTCFGVKISNRTVSSFQSRTWYSSGNAGDYEFSWYACGY